MFSSLATFLFGSNTSAIANSETTAESLLTGENREDSANLVDADNLIEVTSLTPSVTGASGRGQQPQQQQRTAIKRGGKNKRNNTRQQNKRKGILKNGGNAKVTTSLTKLLTPSDSCDEDFDEDDWYIVEKEGEFEKYNLS